MGKGLPRSLSRGPKLLSKIIHDKFALDNVSITVDGAAGVGFGSVVIRGLPEGNINFLGALINLSLSESDAGIVDTFSGDYSVGTTPASDGTLTAGDVDIIPSQPIGPASAGAIGPVRGVHAAAVTGTVYDNTDGSLELNLNLLIDDADISADGTIVIASGDMSISYSMLGDD